MGANIDAIDAFPHSYPHYPQCYAQIKVNIYGIFLLFVYKHLLVYSHYAQVECKKYPQKDGRS